MPKATITGPSLGLWLVLGIILMVVRAFHLADYSWWIAITPFYVPVVAFYAFAAVIYLRVLTGMHPRSMQLGFKKLDPKARLPRYAHEGDAGMDVFALEDTDLRYGRPTLVRTGIAAEIPDGYEIQVRPRSGMAVKGITVWNSPGTVDSKYRGEICVVMMFMKHFDKIISEESSVAITAQDAMASDYRINKGDKIAQLVLSPVTFADIKEVHSLSDTDRGTAGFGSTGR